MVFCPLQPPATGAPWSCENRYPPNCTNELGFQFTSLYTITRLIYDACSSDSRLYEGTSRLTEAACVQMAGPKETNYPLPDVWTRLVAWKFPLVQLIFQFPRPPLGYTAEGFVLCNLIGNPISSLQHLLDKLAMCHARGTYWKKQFSPDGRFKRFVDYPRGSPEHHEDFQRKWKAFGMIIDAFDEWGLESGTQANRFLDNALSELDPKSQTRLDFMRICLRTASMLAADRSTKFLPMGIAQLLFIGTFAIGFGRTASTPADSPSLFMNVEIHSIAFSALFLWVIPAVLLGSIIGVSQTEQAMPLILQDFRSLLRKLYDSDEDAREKLDLVSVDWLYGNDAHLPGHGALSSFPSLERTFSVETVAIVSSSNKRLDYKHDTKPETQHIELAETEVQFRDLAELEEDWVEDKTPETSLNARLRKFSGGLYTWHPLKRWRQTSRMSPPLAEVGMQRRGTLQLSRTISALPYVLTVNEDSRFEKYTHKPVFALSWAYSILLPHLLVGICCIMGLLISYYVPPKGWDGCRHVGELSIYCIWLAAWILDYPGEFLLRYMNLNSIRYLYAAKYAKDFCATAAVIGAIGKTQQGIYNRCSCYSSRGPEPRAMNLPEYEWIAGVLVSRIKTLYPGLAFSCMCVEMLAMWFMLRRYRAGMRIFLQRDDGLPKFWKLRRWFFLWRGRQRSTIKSTKNSYVEAHLTDNPQMQASETNSLPSQADHPSIAPQAISPDEKNDKDSSSGNQTHSDESSSSSTRNEVHSHPAQSGNKSDEILEK